MIHGFEQQTHDLTPDELRLAGLLKSFLMNYKGTDNAITNNEIIMHFKMKHGVNLGTGARVRKMINFIRRTQIPNLSANSKGYWIEDDLRKLAEYRDSLKQRAESIKAVADVITEYIDKERIRQAESNQISMF